LFGGSIIIRIWTEFKADIPDEIQRRLTRRSGTTECSVATLPIRRRLGEGGKFRLIVERVRQNIEERVDDASCNEPWKFSAKGFPGQARLRRVS
jgi:hypothetical protein